MSVKKTYGKGGVCLGMASKVTQGELQEHAKQEGVDPDQSYEELREVIEIHECKWCDDEYLRGWSDEFCSDTCEVEYINEYHRD